MTRRSSNRCTPAKFVVLTDSESVAKAKRNYLTWILSGTILFGVTVGFICHEVFIAPTHLAQQYHNNTLRQLPSNDSESFGTLTPKNLPPKVFFPAMPFREKYNKDKSEFLCEQYQPRLETIPLALRKKFFLEHFLNIYDYINYELIEHYDSIINKYDSKYLKLIFNGYQVKLLEVKDSVDLIDFLGGLASNKFKFYSMYLKEQQFQLNLRNFDWYFALTEELNQWYNYLNRLRDFLSDYEQQIRKERFVNVTEINFETFTNETQEKIFHFVYPFSMTEKKLNEVNEIITEWTKPVNVDYINCSVIFHNRVVLLSEISENLHMSNMSCIKNVYVYASRIIYLDDHLELLGVNLAIISPSWRFLKKIKINLDGASGEEHSSKSASPGQPGKPGNPGKNGGDFLGIGSFEEKFLLISSNGGIGGGGQNGAKGQDGLNNTRPSSPFEKPTCLRQVKVFGSLLPTNVTYYRIYNEAGCGSSGTDGGVGGLGGYGGVITLITKSSKKVRKGLNGALGPFGKGGFGGKGGQNGCFYEAVDENNEFLHPVTTIKCSIGNLLPSGLSGKDNYNNLGQVFPPLKENLSIHDCVFVYIQRAGKHFVEYNDLHFILFLKDFYAFEEIGLDDVLKDFQLIEGFNRMEFYEFFKESFFERFTTADNSTQLVSDYLKSIVLGKMTYLKRNINYYFIDIKNFLNVLQTSIKNTNESIRELEAVSYFKKKVCIKIDEIKENLKILRAKLNATETLFGNWTKYSWKEKSASCIMLITIDVIHFLIDQSYELTFLEVNKMLSMCSMTIHSVQSRPPSKISRSNLIKNPPTNIERIFQRIALQISYLKSNSDMIGHLTDLRDALNELKISDVFIEEKTQLLSTLVDEMERFIGLYDFLEWKKMEELFSKSLEYLKARESSNSLNAETKVMRARLIDVMIAIQLKLAEDVTQQNLQPLFKTNFFEAPRKKTLSDILYQLNLPRDSSDRSPFCKNHMKAIFDRNSSVGEFFSWPNSEIKNKLKVLFSGGEILLKSSLINRHVLDKNFLQFASLKVDFDCPENKSICTKLGEILMNFKIDITHSGYSFYNWYDETHIVVSEKVTLSYNFKTWDNQEPELYNAFFKKCQDGEIKLSPFTTWAFRLYNINKDATFGMLAPYADVVSLNLIGTGTYVF